MQIVHRFGEIEGDSLEFNVVEIYSFIEIRSI